MKVWKYENENMKENIKREDMQGLEGFNVSLR